MADSNIRHGQTQSSDLSESDPAGTELPASPAKETTGKKKKRGSWAFWRSGNKETDAAQQDSNDPESSASDDPLALLNQAETTDDMACAIDQLFANSGGDTRADDLVFDAEEIATSIDFEEESPVTRETDSDNTPQESRSRGRGQRGPRRREDRDDGRDDQNRSSGRRSRNDQGERSRDDRGGRGERSRNDRGERSRNDRGERSRNDRGERSRNDRGERSRDNRGERSRDDRGERSRNDRGERSRDDRGERSRDDRGERSSDDRGERSRDDRRDEDSQNSGQRQDTRRREKPSRPPVDHGDVPTWDTAVSFVVDNNMLTRDQKSNRNRKTRSRPRDNSQD